VICIPTDPDVAILVNSVNNGDILSCVVISSQVSLCMLYLQNYVLLNALSNGLLDKKHISPSYIQFGFKSP
jgi:hypothetical protein